METELVKWYITKTSASLFDSLLYHAHSFLSAWYGAFKKKKKIQALIKPNEQQPSDGRRKAARLLQLI